MMKEEIEPSTESRQIERQEQGHTPAIRSAVSDIEWDERIREAEWLSAVDSQ
jgi:hypothetical protein